MINNDYKKAALQELHDLACELRSLYNELRIRNTALKQAIDLYEDSGYDPDFEVKVAWRGEDRNIIEEEFCELRRKYNRSIEHMIEVGFESYEIKPILNIFPYF